MKGKISVGYDVFFLVASVILFIIFIIKGFDFYLCIIPLATAITALITLIFDLKKQKGRDNI